MNDASAIVWKEMREVLGQDGLRGKSGFFLNIGVFGVLLPLQFGPDWVRNPVSAIAWSWVPMYLVMNVIADAFAGERERHTLETLLASRLSDKSILFGKIAAAIAYAGVVTVASLLAGIVTVNVMHRGEGLLLYDWRVVLQMLVFGLLGALLVASAGVLISLRAATVRQAQQTLGGAIIVMLAIPFAGVRLLPPDMKHLLASPANSAVLGVLLFAVLAAADALLLYFAVIRFRRSALMTAGAL